MKWIIILSSLLMASCAAPRIAPRFNQPSTAAVASSTASARGHVQQAQKQVQQIEKIVERDCPELKLQIADLNTSLASALSDLDTSEGARKQLDSELKTQTATANKLADSYDKQGAQIASLQTSRHRWVKYTWTLGGLLVAALAFIFRKPLFLLLSGL